MQSAKDFGFNEGFILEKGAIPPAEYTEIDSIDGKPLAVPNDILATEYTNYATAVNSPSIPADPSRFGRSFRAAKSVLNTVGITKVPNKQDIKVGVDFKGDPIYSNPILANDQSVDTGKKITDTSAMALGAMGAFKDFNEAQSFAAIGRKASDSSFHSELDTLKIAQDPKGFVAAVSKFSDKNLTEYTSYKLYENWSNLSPSQKSLAIAGTGIQGFRFSDGQTFETKKLTPEIPGTPAMSAAEGLDLAGKGVNVAPATRHWNQFATIQETLYPAKKAADVVFTANSQGLLGHGIDGRAVPVDENILSQSGAELTPHYGVGAATIPQGKGIPKGYTAAANVGGRIVIVPEDNKGTVLIGAPDVANRSASQIYSRWAAPENPVRQNQGVVGGSALVGGLYKMAGTNPYSLGAVVTQSTYEHIGPKEQSNLQHVTETVGISMQRLLKGEANKNTDSKGIEFSRDGEFNEDTFNASMKELRGELAKNGISSKEVGYQLANQGFAEGRFNASQFTALQRSLDMAFDNDGFILAQKLSTGKAKGFEILERRRG